MPPIQQNFKTLDEYNTYAKAHGLDVKPAQTTTTDENGNQVTQDTSFPKSVWEVYAEKDGNKNDNISLSETGIDKSDVINDKKIDSLIGDLNSDSGLAQYSASVKFIDTIGTYAKTAWARVGQSIDQLFANFTGIDLQRSSHVFEVQSAAQSKQLLLDAQVVIKSADQRNEWRESVSKDIESQLDIAKKLAEKELELSSGQEQKVQYATKDEDKNQWVDLDESKINKSKLATSMTQQANITERLNQKFDENKAIKEFAKSDSNPSGVDLSGIKDAAERGLGEKALDTITKSYTNIKAMIGTEDIDGTVDAAISKQSTDINQIFQSATIDNIIKQAEAEALNQIRDEINKARNDAHQKAEQEEAARAQQQGNRPQTAADKIVGGFVDGASRAAGNLAENLFGGGQSSGSVPAGGGTESAAATQTPQEEKQGGIRNPKPKLDNDDMITMSRARNKWGSGTITGKAYISAKDIKEGKMGNVSDVLQKVLSKKGFKDTENNNNIVSRLSSNSTVQEAVIKGNPEVFDKNGKVYGDADWNSLKLPSVKKMKEMIRAEEQA